MAPVTPLRLAALWELPPNGDRAALRRRLLETIRFTDEEMRGNANDTNSDYFLELCVVQENCTEALARLRKRELSREELLQCCATISGFIKDILMLLDRQDLARQVAT